MVLLAVTVACGRAPGLLRSETPHEAYTRGLQDAGLHETALGRDWIAAADRALREPVAGKLPLEGTLQFDAGEARAFGYRLTLQRGRVLRLDLSQPSGPPSIVFIDLFRMREGEAPERIASAERGELSLEHEITRDGEYLLRIQPELLRGGSLKLVQKTTAALTFPVSGRDVKAVGSRFRDPRDGGRREHHGVDIFAPRGTPVLAAAPGVVSSVGTTGLGGNVVWVWDSRRRHSHYYAHLAEQAVSVGQRVNAGDVIGYVGNTGNARTTPPHLHFGIYALGDGPIDPYPFVHGAKGPAAAGAPGN
jgi:murein DD-endopeptidase MepM/ murein hydrolase activator NlpD